MKRHLFWLFGLLVITLTSHAGIMPYHTRIIFHEGQLAENIMLANTNHYGIMVQTWLDNGEGSPDVTNIPFVSVPPIFKLNPSEVKSVRILYNQGKLPEDRESLFWFNMFEIPPSNSESKSQNTVLVTMNTQIKLLYRPKRITIAPNQAIKMVTCRYLQANNILECQNPSPLYLSIIKAQLETSNGKVAATNEQQLMLPPFAKSKYVFEDNSRTAKTLVVTYFNDIGDSSEESLPIIQ